MAGYSNEPLLPHLATFSKAAELSSFTGAAKALRISQASVSQRVQSLEKLLGKPLFKRQGGRVLLTQAGQKVYQYSQRIMELHREIRSEISGQKSSVSGELILGASSVPGEHLLPSLLSTFRKQYPEVRVSATVSDSMSVMNQVERGEVNLGLVGRKSKSPHLMFQYFAKDRMKLIIPPEHPLRRIRKVSVDHLTKYPIILREVGSGLRHSLEKSLERNGRSLSELHIAMELGSNQAIKEAVIQGVGIAVLSTYAIHKEVKAMQLYGMEITDLQCDREMFVVQDKRRVLPSPARLFVSFLENHPIVTASPSV
ncbi:MAG: selenium metabolism-associated LysR family transcriptional regulator [Gemmatales bacterium]